ncbi:uncharacterized protein IL334_003249 [Kwoniella shivajii]|uniref:PIN domain-containing protein n=1 Tax=Kwoniella shivajii TaxID=564305 RepID=A0ABZ1CX14_9TREE|nr:hypothetical protein IL334_003249 [Kwoniella shivajii]
MADTHEEEMIWEPEHTPSKSVHYVAVDTNVFISHLNMMRTIHALLVALRPSPVILLIPSIVIHELDGLKTSKVPSEPGSPITLGRLVQAANTWILEVHRDRRLTGKGALRCQSLKERWGNGILDHGGNDDQILECCLHFLHSGSTVTLWTDDKNLSVKAESNDIPTLGGKQMTLTRFFNSIDEEFPESLWEEIHSLSIYNVAGAGNKNGVEDFDFDIEMDLDHDLASTSQTQGEETRYPYLLPQKHTSTAPSVWQGVSTTVTSRSAPLSPTSTPMDRDSSGSTSGARSLKSRSLQSSPTQKSAEVSPRRSSKSRSPSSPSSLATPVRANGFGPSKILLTSIQLSLRPSLLSLIPHTPTQLQPQPPDDTTSILSTLLETLTILDTTLQDQGQPPNSIIRVSLLRSISSTKTIINYIESFTDWRKANDKGMRRIRLGEVVESLRILQAVFEEFGVDVADGLADVISEIRRLD